MTMDFKVRKWLLVVLAVVVAGALGYTGWYYNYQKTSAPTASPTPAKSITLSPSAATTASPAATSGSQTTGQTGNGTTTPAPTPTPTPPTGWKLENAGILCPGTCGVAYSVFIKNIWTKHSNETMHTPAFYTDKICYTQYADFVQTGQCFNDLIISINGPPSQMGYTGVPADSDFVIKTYDWPTTNNSYYNKVWVIVNKSMSETDQNIIFNSFKINKTSGDPDFSQ